MNNCFFICISKMIRTIIILFIYNSIYFLINLFKKLLLIKNTYLYHDVLKLLYHDKQH